MLSATSTSWFLVLWTATSCTDALRADGLKVTTLSAGATLPETVRPSCGRTPAAVLFVASGGGEQGSQPGGGLPATPRARILPRREPARIDPVGVRQRPIIATRCAHVHGEVLVGVFEMGNGHSRQLQSGSIRGVLR